MTRTRLKKTAALFVAIAASATITGCGTMAQSTVRGQTETPGIGYWKDSAGNVWKNGYGQCWRAGYWTPAMATVECDPDLVPKPAPAPAPRVIPPPPPPPPAAPPPKPAPVVPPPPPKPAAAPVTEKITLSSDVLFDFDKSVVKPEGKTKLDDLVGKLKAVNLEVIIAIGHTDSIGSNAYNQKLSVRRASAVKAYFVSKGIPANRIYTEGKGETNPVATNKTKEGRQKNRRVEIEVVGTRTR